MEDIVVAYINDLMISTKTDNQEEHNKIMLEVLHRLEENGLHICQARKMHLQSYGS